MPDRLKVKTLFRTHFFCPETERNDLFFPLPEFCNQIIGEIYPPSPRASAILDDTLCNTHQVATGLNLPPPKKR